MLELEVFLLLGYFYDTFFTGVSAFLFISRGGWFYHDVAMDYYLVYWL